MPSNPYIVYGTVNSSANDTLANAIITFANITTSSSSFSVFSTVKGQYIFDLAEAGYSSGDTISYESYDEFNNEIVSGTFTVSGENKNLDISLEIIPAAVETPHNKDTQIYNIGGKPVTAENPFPVNQTGIPLGQGSMAISWDANNNPTKLVQTIGSKTYTQNITWDANNNPTNISAWVRS